MKTKSFHLFTASVLFFILLNTLTFGQPWIKNLPQEKLKNNQEFTFYEIQKAFNDYWAPFEVKDGYYIENGQKVKAPGWKQFRRWEWYWQPRVDPVTGEFPKTTAADIRSELRKMDGTRAATGNWTSLGPNSTSGSYAGIGRLNCVAFVSGDNNNRFYAGSPGGGLWKTTDGGSTWTCLTDGNDVLGVSDAVAIPTAGDDILYIATGDRDGGSMWALDGQQSNDNNSIGVLKSTDGGTTWSATALSWSASSKKIINRLLIHPSNTSILYAATSSGLYKTTDGGTTWPLLWSTAEFIDLEFKPGDPTTIYGSTYAGDVWVSTDSGATWTKKLNTSGGRVAIAVSPAQSTWVYALIANSSGGGFNSFWKSTDSGTTFTEQFNGTSSGVNLMGWYCDGSDSGGQGGYDLCVAADPNNASKVFVGGVDTWYSSDGGASWSSANMWTSYSVYNSCGSPVVHADKHFMAYQNGTSTMFECNDGGLYSTSNDGSTWNHLSASGLTISQVYRIGTAQTSNNDVIAGCQDNGTKSMLSGTWTDVMGGDGFDCAIDPSNANIQYGSLYYGRVKKTTNGWGSSVDITSDGSSGINGITETGIWCSPFQIDPNNSSTIYVGMDNLWKSTNKGSSWTKISSLNAQGIIAFDVANSNSSVIYVVESSSYGGSTSKIHVTTDGGSSWTNITGSLPVSSSNITSVAVKADDPNTAWVGMGNYNANGVFETTDGGTTWTDISTGLPSIPVMSVVQNSQNTTEVELYAGTDVGVYVKVGSANWAAFNTGLPNVVVSDLEIYYNTTTSLSRLRAGTFGRGVWETELYTDPTSPPVADFSADKTTPVVDETVNFTDLSSNLPTSWFWSFNPATVTYLQGTSATSQNPIVSFNATGSYEVSLYAENSYGNDTKVKSNYITVSTGSPTYCTADGGGDEFIDGVVLNTISNTSTGYDPSGYHDYTSLSTNLNLLGNYDLTVTNGTTYLDDDMGAWIDWNQDGDFDDPTENIACEVDDDGQGTFNFSVPSSAALGSTALRIRIKYNGSDCGTPCGSTTYGEVEDYTVTVQPGSVTWTGTTSTDWSVATNWSNGEVPTASFNVSIPAAPTGGVFPEITSTTTDAATNDLTIASGASLTLSGALTVNGTLSNNAGNSGLVIKSTASNNGSLITSTNLVDATVERYFEGGKWHLFGTPANGQTANSLYFNHSPEVWLKQYDESLDAWGPTITDLNTPLPPGDGFAIWIETGNNATSSFQGQLNSMDKTVSGLAFTDALHGYNLVANPFPASIDWDQGGWGRTNLDGSVWVYQSGSGYLTRNNHGLGSLSEGIIPSGQGFFVRTTASGGSITIPALARVHSSQSYYKNTEEEEDMPYLVLKVTEENNTDEAWLSFNEECTDGFDTGWDAHKFFSPSNEPQLYFVEDDLELSIDAKPLPGEAEMLIPLDFEAGITGNHLLSLTKVNEMYDTRIILEDMLENKFQDLTSDPDYSFNAVKNHPAERFIVHINPVIAGTDDLSADKLYTVYSFNKKVYIRYQGNQSPGSVQIVDLFGRTIYQGQLKDVFTRIPVHTGTGYLLVRIVDDQTVQTNKVFIR